MAKDRCRVYFRLLWGQRSLPCRAVLSRNRCWRFRRPCGDAEKAIAAALLRFGRIDVLINNAGYGIVSAVEKTPEAEFRAQMATNFIAPAFSTAGRRRA
jgi:NAD(P)-dependent dehydrogenase (short-subunit alcohol dehydrogenase family)